MVKKELDFPVAPRWQSLRNVRKFIKNPIPFLLANVEEYGETYHYYLGGMLKSIITVDPILTQQILRKHNRRFEKSSFQTEKLAKYVGSGLLTSRGAYWLKQRRLIQPGFHRDKLRNVANLMQEEIDAFCDEIAHASLSSNLLRAMSELAFRVVAKTLFTTKTEQFDLFELSNIVSELQAYIIRKERQPYFQWWFRLSGKEKQKLHRSAYAKKILQEFIEDRMSCESATDDLLDMLLATKYEDGTGMTIEQLIDECLILFVAGHETSANTMTWILIEIFKHPNVMHKVVDEVMRASDDPWERLGQLTYTEQVIKETLRLFPPAWALDRYALEDDNYNVYTVQKDCMILMLVYGIHRNPRLWEAPNEFRPDRFSPEEVKNIKNGSYLPFGAGPRYCIGQAFAMMEMKLAIAEIVKRFNFSIETTDIGIHPLISLRPDKEVYTLFKLRK